MKVKCINDGGWLDLTIGKTYEVTYIYSNGDYDIIDDSNENSGYSNWYHKEYFKTLSEIRIERINKLLGL
jgi:hypothetical protein